MAESLYETDFLRWTEQQAQRILNHDVQGLDWENLGEEIAALGRSEKHELETRLEILLEHLLKRCYINSTYDNRGWELTIKEQRKQIRRLLRLSPSLKNYFDEIFHDIYTDARSDVQDLYPGMAFPETYPFSPHLEAILTEPFWHLPPDGRDLQGF
jgi:hypothetical protein